MKLVRTAELPWADALKKGQYSNRRKRLGGVDFGASLWELAPGKKSFPFHRHHGTEEGLFVMSGRAQVRADDGLHEVGPGDFVSFAPGDAHQLINHTGEPFVYLAFSVGRRPDVTEYPDSHKVHVTWGTDQSAAFKNDSAVGYFDGESDAS